MISRIIEFSVRNRWLVIFVWLGIALWGLFAVMHTPVDAIPDLSENQVIVFADWMGRSPQDIEEQVTYPLSVQLQGLAGVKSVRSSSEPNFSMISLIFDDRTDFYFARNRVLERLTTARASLPAGVEPMMAPDATALGQVFWYTVEGGGKSLDELRAIQDFAVRYQLNSVPGVAEVASVGGFARQYDVDIDPAKLRLYELPLSIVSNAIAMSNMSVGGKVLTANSTEYLIRGVGWLNGVSDLENVPVTSRAGVPIRVGDVAHVSLGPSFRRSALENNGEAVGGVVMMRVGENPLAVTEAIKQKIRQMQSGLPEGVRIVPFYDRTRLIESAIHTVSGTLREEIIIASIAILLILTHFRSALVVCVTLPMAVLISFLFMYYLKIPSNIMSLSGIAISIGILVDASVVMVENASHELSVRFGDNPVTGDTSEIVIRSCRLVGTPIFFSVLIMLLSFLPVFAFGGQEGRLSHPLAFTKSFAMLGVAVLAVTLVPALIPLLIRGRLRGEEKNWIVRSFIHIYRPVLSWAIDRPAFVWWMMAVILSLGAGLIASPIASALVLVLGLAFVILGVRDSGWTIWLLVALLTMVFTFSQAGVSPGLPVSARHALPWCILAIATGLTLLSMTLRHWRTAAVASLLAVAFIADTRFRKLGGEFMPELNEGSIMDMPLTAPRVAMGEAVDDVAVRDRLLRSFPETDQAVGKIGRAETATDPSPVDMVETIVSMKPREQWPKRKVLFDDALSHSAVVAAEMQRNGWLKPAEWTEAARSVNDAEFAKSHPLLHHAADLLNTATQIAVDDFDRSTRNLANRRIVEFAPLLAEQLVRISLDDLLAHLRGRSSLLRAPSATEITEILAAAKDHGTLLGQLPRQEEVDKLLQTLRRELVRRASVPDRNDLLIDSPGGVGETVQLFQRAVGFEPPGYAERLFAKIKNSHDMLWEERVKALNWELYDYGVDAINRYLFDTLHRTALGTSLAGSEPPPTALAASQAALTADLKTHLLLWQKSKEDVVREMDRELQMPGWGNVWTQPIINRVNMLATGVRTQIGVKVFGPTGKSLPASIDDVQKISQQIADKLRTIPGAADVNADQSTGKRYVEITIDREKAARYGVNMADLSQAVETAMGGSQVAMTVEGRQRFPVQLRYAPEYWQNMDALGDVLVAGMTTPASIKKPGPVSMTLNAAAAEPSMQPSGSGTIQIPLRMVADIRIVDGPSMIKSENGRLRNYVTLNVRGRDIVGFVDEARASLADIEKDLAGTGMSIEWTGEFENQIHARQTLAVIFPMVVVLILLLLYITFRNMADTLLVFLAVMGALAGAVMFQGMFGFNFSVIVSIGYIAAFGMATQTGVIMLVYLREAIDRKGGLENIASLEILRRCVIEGAVHRLRPKLLTEGVAIVGLVPMLWATGTGAEIMRPMAAPVLGGLLISDEVIDLMIPVLFYVLRKQMWHKARKIVAPASKATVLAPMSGSNNSL